MSPLSTRFAPDARQRFLDGLLFWEGRVNRRDLIDTFRVSQPQAALDLKAYLAALPEGQVTYDTRQKRYEATSAFRPLFGPPDLAPWLERARTARLPVEVLPTLDRPLDAALMARLYRAIRDRSKIAVAYQTMERGEPDIRPISPTAFVSDGLRWHIRAYCHLRAAYRDFVLSRLAIEADARPAESGALPPDPDWDTWVSLTLAPALSLGVNQRRAVCWDYGIEGELTVSVRRALEFYALRRWGLDRPDSRLVVIDRTETPVPSGAEP